jgi:hypothetical protein
VDEVFPHLTQMIPVSVISQVASFGLSVSSRQDGEAADPGALFSSVLFDCLDGL